ncbi:hypothetical protein EVAR_44203_1 [Eumeta japonica]|uniref:Uncharacterized protein n=1 Tax=Eumeta variegata TaxID=151549 RepID=A0A4C1W3L5_EUMVA|nr:hypothetical protein EVAR_44203_1 [Eumeta japonica]
MFCWAWILFLCEAEQSAYHAGTAYVEAYWQYREGDRAVKLKKRNKLAKCVSGHAQCQSSLDVNLMLPKDSEETETGENLKVQGQGYMVDALTFPN